jgi:hypothetical protein
MQTQNMRLTNLVKHLIALVQDEHADVSKTQVLVADKGVETARGADNDVGVSLLVLEDLGILLDGSAAVEDASLDVGHVLAESVVLVADLESQLTSMAHNQDRALSGDRLDLLEGGENKDSRLAETRLGLADDVAAEHGLGNACLLNCSRGPY